jgi:hypothetical protein
MFMNPAKLRRVTPLAVIAAILAVAYMAPLPADASRTDNCGVKGGYAYGGYAFAFHDHGKPCPNRPFPGKGKGILKFVVGSATSSSGATQRLSLIGGNSPGNQTSNSGDRTAPTNGHGHGKGRGHGNRGQSDQHGNVFAND